MSANAKVRPLIAISVGDCGGVGPEISLKAVADPMIRKRCDPVLIGPAAILQQVAKKLNLPCPPLADSPQANSSSSILDTGDLSVDQVRPGQFSAKTGASSFRAVQQAIDLAKAGQVSALVTGPIQKEAWKAAGIEYPGHTELLADSTGTDDFCMMLTSEEISCVLATIHIPLADVPTQLTSEKIVRAIRLGADALGKQLRRPAKVAVCGLNPHAGENGMFSHGEEQRLILPAIDIARGQGIDVTGPLPPDTAFTPAIRKQFDVYVAMYHDQGLIPLKCLSFDEAVNVTLGLPIVRTSVDHGTALDIAWQGKANHRSMLAAIQMAIDLSSE